MQLTDSLKAAAMMDAVSNQAEKDGMADAGNGVHTMPAMFDGEPLLTMQWSAGQRRYEQGLDKAMWRTRCEKMAVDANRGCGLSYDRFVASLSASVDWALEDLAHHERADALAIAIEFGYATEAEREQTAMDNANNGYCHHGIELGCCPAGCE